MITATRVLFVLLLHLAAGSICFADCGSPGLYAWPRTSTILPNQQIVISGYADGVPVSEVIGKKHPVYLVSDKGRVEMEVVAAYMGQFWTSQTLLRPKTKLIAGQVYRLEVKHLANSKYVTRYDQQKREYLPVEWLVKGEEDVTPPHWASVPVEIEKYYHMYGCGPSLGIKFKIECNETQPILVKVQLRGLGTETWITYYLEVDEGKITIGHGMCGGAFTLREATEFEARFTLVDAAGNETSQTGAPIRFTRPAEMNHD